MRGTEREEGPQPTSGILPVEEPGRSLPRCCGCCGKAVGQRAALGACPGCVERKACLAGVVARAKATKAL